jgi:selenocysteine lyase/cysteine desulfurase
VTSTLSPRRVRSAYRDENVRVAAHLYSTQEDVDRLLQALETRRHLLV